jgi:hypothetical protein
MEINLLANSKLSQNQLSFMPQAMLYFVCFLKKTPVNIFKKLVCILSLRCLY